MNLLLNKLREPSTWRGITILLTAVGIRLHPELADSVVTLGVAAAGAIEVIRKERSTPAK
jgi:hypothetical protein